MFTVAYEREKIKNISQMPLCVRFCQKKPSAFALLQFCISAKQIVGRQQPYRLPSTIHGLSHGLKIARLLAIFTPVCGLVPPFQVRFCQKKPSAFALGFFWQGH
jgi:hypothetical protein